MRFFLNKTNNDTRPNAIIEPFSLQKFQPNLFTKFRDKHADGRTHKLSLLSVHYVGTVNTYLPAVRSVIRTTRNKSKQYIIEYYLCK
jgi:hypothetical protein